MARVRRMFRLCLARTRNEEEEEIILMHTLKPNDNYCLNLDENGKIQVDGQDIDIGAKYKNQQLYFQVIKTKQTNDASICVTVQASLVPASYNLKTLSDLTCGNVYCCNQLFNTFLYKTKLKFVFDVPNKCLTLIAHKHGHFGTLYLYFDLVDKIYF